MYVPSICDKRTELLSRPRFRILCRKCSCGGTLIRSKCCVVKEKTQRALSSSGCRDFPPLFFLKPQVWFTIRLQINYLWIIGDDFKKAIVLFKLVCLAANVFLMSIGMPMGGGESQDILYGGEETVSRISLARVICNSDRILVCQGFQLYYFYTFFNLVLLCMWCYYRYDQFWAL